MPTDRTLKFSEPVEGDPLPFTVYKRGKFRLLYNRLGELVAEMNDWEFSDGDLTVFAEIFNVARSVSSTHYVGATPE